MMQMVAGIILTIGVLLIFTAFVYFGNIIFDQEKLHHSLKLGKNHKFFEFTIFKFALYALLACWSLIWVLEWWGAPRTVLMSFKSSLLSGTSFYGTRIIPLRLIMALMAFAIIQMAWKYTLLYLSKTKRFDSDPEAQIIITSLLSYVVLAIAILCGLMVSGVDFTGLAIIAGALSLGIGFGLQNIVNNFVSGIILLIERPIKPGDLIQVKGYEGYVREISFRFTRIETMQKEDVIIPNSDLISTPIINYEFDNRLSKIKCRVGVAYNSDLELVKEVLLNLALKHQDVLNDPANKPVVQLYEFGENNLLFDLHCTITDVTRKGQISSDLNWQIAAAFSENNIVMAYPQRDVHIKQED